jgi:hypothetical protein
MRPYHTGFVAWLPGQWDIGPTPRAPSRSPHESDRRSQTCRIFGREAHEATPTMRALAQRGRRGQADHTHREYNGYCNLKMAATNHQDLFLKNGAVSPVGVVARRCSTPVNLGASDVWGEPESPGNVATASIRPKRQAEAYPTREGVAAPPSSQDLLIHALSGITNGRSAPRTQPGKARPMRDPAPPNRVVWRLVNRGESSGRRSVGRFLRTRRAR